MPRHDEFAVNLIADDVHVVACAYCPHALQFFARPYASGGIVRVAEQKHGGLLIGTLALEVVPVDGIGVAFAAQLVLCQFASLVANAGEEAIVDWSLYQHALAREGKRLDAATDGGHHAAGIKYPVTPDVPLVSAMEPRDDGLVVALVYLGVTEHAMGHTLGQSPANGWSSLEVHVRHPERQGILGYGIPFVGACVTAVDDLIERLCGHGISGFGCDSRALWHTRRR